MKTMTRAEWLEEGEKRFGPDVRKWLFVCPSCGTAQSAEDFYAAGFERGKGEVNKYLGFSCIGRFSKDKGCDWTLGGLFHIHTLEVIDDEGEKHMRFDFVPMLEVVD